MVRDSAANSFGYSSEYRKSIEISVALVVGLFVQSVTRKLESLRDFGAATPKAIHRLRIRLGWRGASRENMMTIEHARTDIVSKPWGSNDLRPWSKVDPGASAIGEIWFQRSNPLAEDPALLLKLLFTSAPLSIQVHPDDAFAKSIGLPNGKTEAWYVLSAKPGAKLAVGLKRRLTAPQLRAAIDDGSIVQHVQWRNAETGDTVFVPAGTIHAIGGGLVIAEFQQRSDTTYRMFDYGRNREVHADRAAEVANAGPAEGLPVARRLSDSRILLMSCPYFVVERVVLPACSSFEIKAERETWLLVIEGQARVTSTKLLPGNAVYLCEDRGIINVGSEGLTALVAYVGDEIKPGLLHDLGHSELPVSASEARQ